MGTRMRRVAVIAAAVAVIASTGGCSLVQTVSCPSWVAFESDEDRAADAAAVVVTTAPVPDGTMDILGYAANAYLVTVGESEKGGLAVGDRIRVGSTADNCAEHPYGEGDPMQESGTLRVFLAHEGGSWRTLTPFDGVRAID